MSTVLERASVLAALSQRLRAVSELLCDAPSPAQATDPPPTASALLDQLVPAVHRNSSPQRIWLLCVAVFGAFPTAEDVLEGVRLFRRATVTDATLWLLDASVRAPVPGAATTQLQIVTDRVVVDVDHSARFDLHTGIQQVVRRTVPIWKRDHDVTMVAWTDLRQSFRTLLSDEAARVERRSEKGAKRPPSALPLLVVPWRTVVVLAETPPREACERLAALAQFSGNVVVAVGYDCMPIVSADLVHPSDPGRFAQYLTIIKHSYRVAGISTSATAEFRGFADAVAGQGLRGPTVIECALPTESVESGGNSTPLVSSPAPNDVPLVLSVGSLEPRKNHLALLFAAERLWRDGYHFRLLFIGGSGWGDEVPRRIAEMRAAGRPVEARRAVTDDELAAAYRTARFTVFASLHEGYGLPVAESLAMGTPVITSNYGSTKEIGEPGGALLIDPRDDDMIMDAMRSLLTDHERLGRLRAEIAERPVRTWEQFAAELWENLVLPASNAVCGAVGRS